MNYIQEINWLWERVRSALEEQQPATPVRPKSAPKSSGGAPRFSKSMRPSSGNPPFYLNFDLFYSNNDYFFSNKWQYSTVFIGRKNGSTRSH